MTCKKVLYRGIVQGVGFRMTTRQVARQFIVAGYVKNLPDGSVEVVVAGADDEIERFLGALSTRMADYIREQDIQDEPWQDFATFEIRS